MPRIKQVLVTALIVGALTFMVSAFLLRYKAIECGFRDHGFPFQEASCIVLDRWTGKVRAERI
jgi:hypothetical protein